MTSAEFIDNPNWAGFIPEMSSATSSRHLPTHEDCARLDQEAAVLHLRKGGTLGKMPNYEERPGQIDMSSAIVHAFNEREHLMIEAGTGVGKSLAYLVPSILWAWTNDTPVIISTATRNLQAQLMNSDIPKALNVLGADASKFKVALLKGRGNYLCLRAVGEIFAEGYWTMEADDQALIPDFIEWFKSTPDGDLDTYEGFPRHRLTCPGEDCSGRRCPFYSKCFVFKARKRAAESHLVVVNHALVLAEASSSGGAILPSYGRLILDEAHNLESIATDYFGFELSLPNLMHILNRLIRRGKGKRSKFAGGALASIEHQVQKGLFIGTTHGERIDALIKKAIQQTTKIVTTASKFFAAAEWLLAPAEGRSICRYKVVDGQRYYSLHGLFTDYQAAEWDESTFLQAQANFEAVLADLVNSLHKLCEALEDSVPEGEFNYFGDLSSQVAGIADSLIAFANEANFVISANKDTYAYWVERVQNERRQSYLRLVAAPLSVADDLKKKVYDVKDSVVLCSATLRVGNDFRYMARRLGCAERFQMLTATSPFDYFRQARVLAVDSLPDPSSHPAEYAETVALLMRDLFSVTRGRALVLFTSYEMMNAVAASAHHLLADAGITLLVQGEGLSRESITRHLKEDADTVVFGAQSFWEGVDVAGEALSCVVLARLPFAQVGDPIIEARSEKINRDGGKAFPDYMLPEAVIKFRQGFGRLIRTKADRGVVVVTDPRLVTKNYGATFRTSIPATVHTITGSDELLREVTDFFA